MPTRSWHRTRTHLAQAKDLVENVGRNLREAYKAPVEQGLDQDTHDLLRRIK